VDPKNAGAGFKVLFVVANESNDSVRERLIIHDPARLFGPNGNRLTGEEVGKAYDFSKILAAVPNSDWNPGIVGTMRYKALQDLETDGAVKQNITTGRKADIYGPLFVLPHDFRIVMGISGAVADRGGKRR
jgi:hypothetical protein